MHSRSSFRSRAAPNGKAEMAEEDPRQRYKANLQGEVDGASLYRTLAQTEKNPELAQVYARLGAVEEAHAEFWKRKIRAIGQRVPSLRPSFRTQALAWLARRFGPAFVLPSINTLEKLDSGTYDRQPEAVAGGLPAAERSHARIIEALAAPSPRVQRPDDCAAGRPASCPRRQCAARRRARSQ